MDTVLTLSVLVEKTVRVRVPQELADKAIESRKARQQILDRAEVSGDVVEESTISFTAIEDDGLDLFTCDLR